MASNRDLGHAWSAPFRAASVQPASSASRRRLRDLANSGDAEPAQANAFGQKYVVRVSLKVPIGKPTRSPFGSSCEGRQFRGS
jgi:hypothetical protein